MMAVASECAGYQKIVTLGRFHLIREVGRGRREQPRHRAATENSPSRLAAHTWVLSGRVLRRWRRDPATFIESLIVPVVLLVTLNIVFGDGISQLTGHSALYGSVPLIAMVGAMSGAMVSGTTLMRERGEGFLSRLWVLPVHRASGLTSRLAGEAIRILITTAVILITGVVLGFRFRQGIVESVTWLFVPVAFGLAFSVAVITLALYAANQILVDGTQLIWTILMFFSTGFVPLDQYPGWLQPVVEHQPLSRVIEAMRGLAMGGPVWLPMRDMLAWSVGIVAVCAAPMAIGFRRASMRG